MVASNRQLSTVNLFNFHTYYIDEEPCLLNVDVADLQPTYPEHVKLSIGLHPWKVGDDWRDAVSRIRQEAQREDVWAIGECGLDKVRGESIPVQMEAFRAQMAVAEEVRKPMIIHCVRAFAELLAIRKELEMSCKKEGRKPQTWVIHGFRGKPEQAKQLMAKGMLLSFGHQYNVETLRWVAGLSGLSGNSENLSIASPLNPFFLETDDLRLSVRQIYGQAARHLDVDVSHLSRLCDPRTTLFSRQNP